MVINNLPALLIYKGVKLEQKVTPVENIPRLLNDNNNKDRSFDEQKKRNVQTTAVVLRISKQGQN